jgi:amino acid adenylation domain-containing protein
MTDIDNLLARLKALDIRLALQGDRVTVSAPVGALTAELRAELASKKEELKAHLRAPISSGDAFSQPIERIPRLPLMPVSHTQQRLWFLKTMEPDNTAYNIPTATWMRGKLDVPALERSLNDLIARHESLRTRFVEVEGIPRAAIEPEGRIDLVWMDLTHVPPERHEAEARRAVAEFAQRPFKLGVAPLLHVMVIRLAPEVHVCCFVVDHIIADGISLGILSLDFHVLYTAHVTGTPPRLPPLPVQYADYVEWDQACLAGGVLDQQLAFWKKELGGSLPVLQLPTDRPRPRLQTHNGATARETLDLKYVAQLKAAARSENVTLFMLMLGAWQVLLYRYTGEEDLPIGSAVANRNRPEVERVVGFFANNIVLRGNAGGNPTVRELLLRVRDTALNAYAHQDMPFDLLVNALATRRDLEHSPLFQVMFVLNSLPLVKLEVPGLEGEPLFFESNTSRFDLSLDVFDTVEGLKLILEYNTDLFEKASMERLLAHYCRLLDGFIKDRSVRIGDVPMLTESEGAQILGAWNRTATAFSSQATVHQLFEARAASNPDALAVTCGDDSLSYRRLNEQANQLARHLQQLGVRADTLVGLSVHRSVEMIVGMLGILKAGGAYVPLDPGFPPDRIELMVRDSALDIVVTQESLAEALPGAEVRKVRIDADWPEIERQPQTNLTPVAQASNLAYVIYTSGSTGIPKGVQLEHRSVVNFLETMHREPGIGADDRLLAVTTLSFDIAGLEIFGPLTAGGSVIIAERSTALDGIKLAELIDSADATILQATPATWRVLLESGWTGKPDLKMLCGGEALPRDLADRLLPLGSELWNMYGPTETTIWSLVERVVPGEMHPGIGRPIANTQVYILDAARRPVPVGVPGELYIGGDGLARGYLKRPELNAERFVADPFSTVPNARMYRTGDLARWRADGTVQCLGRADHQVKIRGYRIEPGEIEAMLAKHADVVQNVVVARADSTGEQRLVAYVIARAGVTLDPADLRKFLAHDLPEYMVPSTYVALEQFPLTPNGKIDRKALPEPGTSVLAVSTSYAAPTNEIETAVAGIWQEVLKVPRVGRNDNFFDLGGHSLLIVQVQSRVQKQLGRVLPIVEFFQYPTVVTLAARLSSNPVGEDRVSLARDRGARRKAALRKEAAT